MSNQNNIKAQRQKLGLDIRTFAILLGLKPGSEERVLRWETGREKIPVGIAKRLLKLPEKIHFQRKDQKNDFSFIDLFAGIGGIRLPFQELGGKCVFTSEWDRHSQITYAANFGEAPEKNGDITSFSSDEIPRHDLLLAGFPCQAFSQAGKKEGFYDTRGTMFFEIQRILAHHRPKAFLLENVKQLKGHNKGATLKTILATLRGNEVPRIATDVPMSKEARKSLRTPLNYNTDVCVLKARDFGVPQNRERIYIVGFDRSRVSGAERVDFVKEMFERVKSKRHSVDSLEKALETDSEKTDPFTISDRLWAGHQRRKSNHLANGNGFGFSLFTKNSPYCNTISARYYKDGSEILIAQPGRNPRKLTPREAANIQGFPSDFFIDAVSHTQAYRQFGNSVAVPVIDAIAREMTPFLID